jgi:hypothetical protein
MGESKWRIRGLKEEISSEAPQRATEEKIHPQIAQIDADLKIEELCSKSLLV